MTWAIQNLRVKVSKMRLKILSLIGVMRSIWCQVMRSPCACHLWVGSITHQKESWIVNTPQTWLITWWAHQKRNPFRLQSDVGIHSPENKRSRRCCLRGLKCPFHQLSTVKHCMIVAPSYLAHLWCRAKTLEQHTWRSLSTWPNTPSCRHT